MDPSAVADLLDFMKNAKATNEVGKAEAEADAEKVVDQSKAKTEAKGNVKNEVDEAEADADAEKVSNHPKTKTTAKGTAKGTANAEAQAKGSLDRYMKPGMSPELVANVDAKDEAEAQKAKARRMSVLMLVLVLD